MKQFRETHLDKIKKTGGAADDWLAFLRISSLLIGFMQADAVFFSYRR